MKLALNSYYLVEIVHQKGLPQDSLGDAAHHSMHGCMAYCK
jgi:hypothetical protein